MCSSVPRIDKYELSLQLFNVEQEPEWTRYLFRPKSVAVIGASRNPEKVGHVILKNILDGGFPGKVYPVNPNADEILGLKCYPTVKDIPSDVELSVVSVPAGIVPQVVEECGEAGVKVVVVISAGFKETGSEGARLEREVVSVCRKYGMRMQGPNCLGVIDTETPLNASFAPKMPMKGNVAFISQSGALCTAMLDLAEEYGLGFSKFISLGNKADLDETDFIKAVASDRETSVILLYVESVERGRKFIEAAAETSRRKPIVALKGGVSEFGTKAASSHTGALAGSLTAYVAAFRRAGIIFAKSLEEMVSYAMFLSRQPLPKGRNVAIVTNAGGLGILAADACATLGLRVSPLSPTTVSKLKSILPPMAAVHNPVDILGDADPERYEETLEVVLEDDGVHGAIVLLSPQAMTNPVGTAKVLLSVRRRLPYKPIVASFVGWSTVEEARKMLIKEGIPCLDFPEKAVLAMAGASGYVELVSKPVGEPTAFYDVDPLRVRGILKEIRRDGRVVALLHEALEIVRAYGIHVPTTAFARNRDEAAEMAEEIGFPVALKVVSPQVVHKTDVGGVFLNLQTPGEVKRAYDMALTRVMTYMPGASIHGVIVQKMVPMGKELIVGSMKDPTFGHLVMFGLGGIYVDLIKDVSFRLAPLSVEDALGMVKETKAYTLLRGIRGEQPSDINAVVNTILRVGRLVMDFPEIVELDINPLIAYGRGQGCLALDVKITLSSEEEKLG